MQGQKDYQGSTLVARDLTWDRLQELRGRRVVVLGGGKSAVDACAAAVDVASSVVMLYRKVSRRVLVLPCTACRLACILSCT